MECIKIDIAKNMERMATEEELLNQATMESIYQIRALKAMLAYGEEPIRGDHSQVSGFGQYYFGEFGVYLFVDKVEL